MHFSVWTRVLNRGWGAPPQGTRDAGDVSGCHKCRGCGAVLESSGETQRRCDAPYNTQDCPTTRNGPAPDANREGSQSRLGLGPRSRVPVLRGARPGACCFVGAPPARWWSEQPRAPPQPQSRSQPLLPAGGLGPGGRLLGVSQPQNQVLGREGAPRGPAFREKQRPPGARVDAASLRSCQGWGKVARWWDRPSYPHECQAGETTGLLIRLQWQPQGTVSPREDEAGAPSCSVAGGARG